MRKRIIKPDENMVSIVQRNLDIGEHWFSPAAMKFFNTRLESNPVLNGNFWYFITSETGLDSDEHRFSIRAEYRGRIITIGDFRAYATLNDATKALKTYLDDVEQDSL